MKETIKIKNNMDAQALKKLVIEKMSDVACLNTTSFAPLYLDIVAVSLIAVIILLVVNWFDIGTQRIIGIGVIMYRCDYMYLVGTLLYLLQKM